jgi:hypothetical protein
MKRAHLKSRRVRVVLPASRQSLPVNTKQFLIEAFALGTRQAIQFVGSREVRSELFEKELKELSTKIMWHQALHHLCSAFFFSGLHLEIEALSKQQSMVSSTTLRNMALTGSMLYRELALAQLCLSTKDNVALFHIRISGMVCEWWIRQCAGAITVARLAHFLLSEGFCVFLPTPAEDVYWKIDLIASKPGESISICFQVKSDQRVEWLDYQVLHSPPNGHASEATHRFFKGVSRFQAHTHGVYVPVELKFGSRQFDDGAVVAKGYFLDTLRQVTIDVSL